MNYEQKYLKYKSKYLVLKAELEGSLFGSAINPLLDSKLDESQKLQYKIKELQRIIIQSEEGIKNNKLSTNELIDKIKKTKEEINELEIKLQNLQKNKKSITTSSPKPIRDAITDEEIQYCNKLIKRLQNQLKNNKEALKEYQEVSKKSQESLNLHLSEQSDNNNREDIKKAKEEIKKAEDEIKKITNNLKKNMNELDKLNRLK